MFLLIAFFSPSGKKPALGEPMIFYCLKSKRHAVENSSIADEIMELMRVGVNQHPDFFFRRIPLTAFNLPREALWCLILFHQGRNKHTGNYCSSRTIKTGDEKGFRIGETIRYLEKAGLIIKRGGWTWTVPQESAETNQKFPALRASLFDSFLQNPTKEKRIALRFLLYLSQLKKEKTSYRNIQEGINCSTETARFLAKFYSDKKETLLTAYRVKNRIFNWQKEGNKMGENGGGKIRKIVSKTAPNKEKPNPLKKPKKATSCTELGGQYKALRKEISPSITKTPTEKLKKIDGFFEPLKKLPLRNFGIESPEILIGYDNMVPSLKPFEEILPGEEARVATKILFGMAKKKPNFKDVDDDTLAKFIVDIWLEVQKRKPVFKTSFMGYFFASLKNNLAANYCRMDLKIKHQEKKIESIKALDNRLKTSHLMEIQARTRKIILDNAERLSPNFTALSFVKNEQRAKAYFESYEDLKGRGEITFAEAILFEFCESHGETVENLSRFLMEKKNLCQEFFKPMEPSRHAA